MKRQAALGPDAKSAKKIKKYPSESKLKEITSIFLSSKQHANILVDLLEQFQKPNETPAACVKAVENIFVEVLNRRDMAVSDSNNDKDAETQYKDWLCGCYEDALVNLTMCLQKGTPECQLQALNSFFKLLSVEAKYPITTKKKKKRKSNFPVNRLKNILLALYSSPNLSADILVRLSEYLEYKDVCGNFWLAVESLLKETCKEQPIDKSIWNLLLMLSRLPKPKKAPDVLLCDVKNVLPEDSVVRSAVTSSWQQMSRWRYSPTTTQLMMVVLVEHIMPVMDNPIFLTDYLMDALYRDECEINMLALQGIFNLVIKHNIEYPNIFVKLYQLFTVNTLKAKYKTRLFALADEFLKSTHLPLAMVAGFAKRFSRLLLSASPPDLLILLTFIANLMIRHPQIRFLCHKPDGKDLDDDPYVEEETNPVKSNAMESQLWEVRLLQHHSCDRVVRLASVINNDLPSAEFPLEPLLDLTWLQMIKKDIKLLKKKIPQVAQKFEDKPLSSQMESARRKEIELLFADLRTLFDCS